MHLQLTGLPRTCEPVFPKLSWDNSGRSTRRTVEPDPPPTACAETPPLHQSHMCVRLEPWEEHTCPNLRDLRCGDGFHLTQSFYLFWLRWALSEHRKPVLRLSLVAESGGLLSSCAARAPHLGGFSRGAPAIGRAGFSCCGPGAWSLRGMWDLPRSGIEPASPTLATGFFITEPPRKPQCFLVHDS